MSKSSEIEAPEAVQAALRTAVGAVQAEVRAGAVLHLPAHDAQWMATGISVTRGETVTLLSSGIAWLSRAFDLFVTGGLSLWYRIGGGPIGKVGGDTFSFTAERNGPLELICHLAGQWIDESGRFDPASTLEDGGLCVAALVWRGDRDAGLAAFAAVDSTGLAAREVARIAAFRPLPPGWAPLWRVGATSIFCEAVDTDAPPRIACRCVEDAGIIKYPLSLELTDDLAIAWDWRIQRLPSTVAEDIAPTHDYLSLAVEFDTGQDLTYFWSSSLPAGTTFRCPLPWWDQVETHMAVRSGAEGLGQWLGERQPLLSDYRRCVGGADPARVVGVWIIALSAFQRGTGLADFARIRLEGAGGQTWIGP